MPQATLLHFALNKISRVFRYTLACIMLTTWLAVFPSHGPQPVYSCGSC
jgi:hypothetical protein